MGDYMNNKKVTMQNIADKLGITKVSVSKALNGQPGISNALRQKIISSSIQMGYTNTKLNKKTENYNFALLCPKRFFLEDENFYTTIYYYLNKKATSNGHTLTQFIINSEEETSNIIPSQLYNNNYDGIFLAGELRHEFLTKLTELQIPLVCIDFYTSDLDIDSIVTDNFYLGYQATSYLIEQGHKKIGFVGNIFQTSSVTDRYFGYYKALQLNNLEVVDDWHISNNDPVTGMYTLQFHLPKELPTAFVCHCDKAAYTLMDKLKLININVPNDVSLISFDNTDLCEYTAPKLTSMDISQKEIAYYSLNQMLFRVKNPDSMPQRLYTSNKLIIRDSIKTL